MADEANTEETEAPKKDGRIKILANVPEKMNHPVDLSEENLKKLASGKTKEQPRAEFIREMWATKHYDRSAITKMCQTFGDDPEMKYQIVFQATKGHEGGPDKPAKEEAAEEAAE